MCRRWSLLCFFFFFYISSITEQLPWSDPELPPASEPINISKLNKSDKNSRNLKAHLSWGNVGNSSLTSLLINPDKLRTERVIATLFNLKTKHWFPQHYFVMSCLQRGSSSWRSGMDPISCYLVRVWKASLYSIQAGFCRGFCGNLQPKNVS